jgi:hypothetical protein
MELATFEKSVSRLIKTYGELFYSLERQKAIYNLLSAIPDGEFEELTTYIICNNRSAPMARDFLNARGFVKEERERTRKILNAGHATKGLKINTSVACDQCYQHFHWTGYVPNLEEVRLCEKCKEARGFEKGKINELEKC